MEEYREFVALLKRMIRFVMLLLIIPGLTAFKVVIWLSVLFIDLRTFRRGLSK